MTLIAAEPRRPREGEIAPDFTLPSTADREVTLSAFRGVQPVLLAFFPLAFTGTCTAEVCAFSDDYDRFAEAGVAVFPISVDSVPTLKEFAKRHAPRTEMLSDFKREVVGSWDLLIKDRFFSHRAYFLIDREGVVRWAHVEEQLGERRDNAEILDRIAALG